MNLTKDFNDYVSTVQNSYYSSQYKPRLEKYDKCTEVLVQLKDVESQLTNLIQQSKISSVYNESHLKFTKIGEKINKSLKTIEGSINSIQKKDLVSFTKNNFEKETVSNTLVILINKHQNISLSYQKFLKTQGDIIRKIEQRKSNIVSSKPRSKNNMKVNNLYDLPEQEPEDNTGFLEYTQVTKSTNDTYYEERGAAVQNIEKLMNDLSQMFNRISEMVYRQGEMINRIDNNTDVALNNLNATQNELIKLKDDVSSNRWLLMKVFLIIIVCILLVIILS